MRTDYPNSLIRRGQWNEILASIIRVFYLFSSRLIANALYKHAGPDVRDHVVDVYASEPTGVGMGVDGLERGDPVHTELAETNRYMRALNVMLNRLFPNLLNELRNFQNSF